MAQSTWEACSLRLQLDESSMPHMREGACTWWGPVVPGQTQRGHDAWQTHHARHEAKKLGTTVP